MLARAGVGLGGRPRARRRRLVGRLARGRRRGAAPRATGDRARRDGRRRRPRPRPRRPHRDARRGGAGLDGPFDLITFWDVLEHLRDPRAELAHRPRPARARRPDRVHVPERRRPLPAADAAPARPPDRRLGVPGAARPPLRLLARDGPPRCSPARASPCARSRPTRRRSASTGRRRCRRERLGTRPRERALRAAFEALRLVAYPLARLTDRGNAQFVLAGAAESLGSPAMREQTRTQLLERIGPGDVVLDVGSWADPFERADWVIDMFPYETRGLYARNGWIPAGREAMRGAVHRGDLDRARRLRPRAVPVRGRRDRLRDLLAHARGHPRPGLGLLGAPPGREGGLHRGARRGSRSRAGASAAASSSAGRTTTG